jgi:hypothetical protein
VLDVANDPVTLLSLFAAFCKTGTPDAVDSTGGLVAALYMGCWTITLDIAGHGTAIFL